MARVSNRSWQVILGVAAVLLLIAWMFSGGLILGLAALFLLLAAGGGALLYHFQGPPER